MLLLGTGDGVYRTAGSADDADRVLDCGRVVELSETPDGIYAATRQGLYRTDNGGDTWTDLDVPNSDVWAVHESVDQLYAGCYPDVLYTRADGGSWQAVTSLDSAPDRPKWYCPENDERGRVRTIRTVPGRPDRLLVGIEVGGLYCSDDRTQTWVDQGADLDDDLHFLEIRGPEEYLACCGKLDLSRGHTTGGLFRTTDGGESWTRLDLGDHNYVRETLRYDGVRYVSGSAVTPGDWGGEDGAEATLFESRDGSTFERIPYPGEPVEIVLSWTVDDGTVYGGTGTRAYDEGRLIRREDGTWVDAGRTPTNVFSLAAV